MKSLLLWGFKCWNANNLKVNVKKIQFDQNDIKLFGLTVNVKEKTPFE
jgi:hypothetical protein